MPHWLQAASRLFINKFGKSRLIFFGDCHDIVKNGRRTDAGDGKIYSDRRCVCRGGRSSDCAGAMHVMVT